MRKNRVKNVYIEFLNGKKIDVTKYVSLPFALESLLDETHGTAKLLITGMQQKDFPDVRIDKPFNANTPMEISFEGQSAEFRMIVARDTAEMARKDGYATWSHNVELVDEAKLLEQEPVDNLTFKNTLPRNYEELYATWDMWADDNERGFATGEKEKFYYWDPAKEKAVYEKGMQITINDSLSTFAIDDSEVKTESGLTLYLHNFRKVIKVVLTVTKPNGDKIVQQKSNYDATYIYNGAIYYKLFDSYFDPIIFDIEGEYQFNLCLYWGVGISAKGTINAEAYFLCGSLENSVLTPYTMQSVIQRVLDTTPTKANGSANKYTFKNDAVEYATEEAPEFTFTGKHLFEVMLDIASYKKKFPALYKNEIYFRPFWNGISLTSEDLPPPIRVLMNSSVDQYCTALDSYVENMVCINDTNVGTVVEPYAGGYITPRSSGGSEISEVTAMIPTQSPIYYIVGLDVGQTNGVEVGDIRAYLYEQDDYDSLSDVSIVYPYSKAYALKFDRFSNGVYELGHRIKAKDILSDARTYPALANILEAKTDGAVDLGQTLKSYLSAFIGEKTAAPFADILFRPTYIPVVNARVRQYKPLLTEENSEATTFYNQQAEVVDSELFGEHLKGLIQKLGNHTELRVYRFNLVDDVPTVGTLIDGKSVYDVAMTIYETHVDATICLVDYAELSQYVGVKNEIKTSDISTTKWCNRYVNWEEFFVFTHDSGLVGNASSITDQALNSVVAFTNGRPLTCAMFTTYSESGDEIVTALAPIKHLAVGNSIYFQWEMLDNFAVGYQSEKAPAGATSISTGTQYDRAQRAVRYCDSFGRAKTVDFNLLYDGPNYTNSVQYTELSTSDYSYTITGETLTFTLAKAYSSNVYVSFGEVFSFVISKGSTVCTTTLTSALVEAVNGNVPYVRYEPMGREAFFRMLAHEYPKMSKNISFELSPVIALKDLYVDKNSSEALKFAAQYHFRQTWKDFVIGSGMSNFSSLIGGSCTKTEFYVSNQRLNPFDRHINVADASIYTKLTALPTFSLDSENKRIVITLPSDVNAATVKSWCFVGLDRNGNAQLIFGENRIGTLAFERTIYLVARDQKTLFRVQYKKRASNATTLVRFFVGGNEKVLDPKEGLNLLKGETLELRYVGDIAGYVNVGIRRKRNGSFFVTQVHLTVSSPYTIIVDKDIEVSF